MSAAAAEPARTELRVVAVVLPSCRASTSQRRITCTHGERPEVTVQRTAAPGGSASRGSAAPAAVKTVTASF